MLQIFTKITCGPVLNFIQDKILLSVPHQQRQISLVCKSLDVGGRVGFAEKKYAETLKILNTFKQNNLKMLVDKTVFRGIILLNYLVKFHAVVGGIHRR